MSGSVAEDLEVGQAETVSHPRDLRPAALRVVLAAVVLGAVLTGTRPASLGELHQALASGGVTTVKTVGGLPPGDAGQAEVDILWHDGLLPRYTTDQQVSETRPWRQCLITARGKRGPPRGRRGPRGRAEHSHSDQ